MARLFTCGFEEGTLAASAMWHGSTGSPQLTTTVVHSGTYALRCPGSGLDGVFREIHHSDGTVADEGDVFFIRTMFRVASGTIAAQARFMSQRAGGTPANWQVELATDRRIVLVNVANGASITSANPIPADTWVRIEIRHVMSTTAGALELFIDGVSQGALTGINSLNASSALRHWFNGGNFGVDIFFDDIAANDNTGTFQNGLPGPGKVALLTPDSDVSVTWTRAGSSPASTNFDGVNDVPGTPDDAVTYNVDSGQTNVDRLSLSDLPAEVPSNAVIRLLDGYARVGSNGTTNTRRLRLKLWDNTGALTDGPFLSCDTSSWRISSSHERVVYDAAGKTKADIAGFNVGYKGESNAAVEQRVSAVWVNVEWIEAQGGGAFTLTADAGVFTLAGQAAGLLVARRLTADHGTFLLSGQAADTRAARVLQAAHGMFSVFGQSANLIWSGATTTIRRIIGAQLSRIIGG